MRGLACQAAAEGQDTAWQKIVGTWVERNKCFVCFPRRTPAGKLDIVVEIVAVFTKFRDHEDVASVWPALLDAVQRDRTLIETALMHVVFSG